MARQKKKWPEFTESQKRAFVIGGAVEALMTVAALRDLAKRPAAEVRGPKAAWVLAFVVQPVGPLAYFRVGRR